MQPKSIVNTNKPIAIYNQYVWAVLEHAGRRDTMKLISIKHGLKIQMFHGNNNRKQDAITDPVANYECDVQDEPTCLAEHKTR
jgi:hypothetical protein